MLIQKIAFVVGLAVLLAIFSALSSAYPPAVGIMDKAPNCIVCHPNNGPWVDDEYLVIDVLDKETKESLRQSDGSFLIEVPRNESRTVLNVIGRNVGDSNEAPFRNAWVFFDPQMVETSSLSKFAAGWEVSMTYGCRLVGDKLNVYPGATLTVTPMTVRPTDSAKNGSITWMLGLTKGDPPKGKPDRVMIGNYYEHTVKLVVK